MYAQWCVAWGLGKPGSLAADDRKTEIKLIESNIDEAREQVSTCVFVCVCVSLLSDRCMISMWECYVCVHQLHSSDVCKYIA